MIECRHLENGSCGIASQLAGRAVLPILSQCTYCTEQAEAKQCINKVTVSLAIRGAVDAATRSQIMKDYGYLLTKVVIENRGPGTELKKIIEWFPLPQAAKKKNCARCKSLERRMNKWGCDVCNTTKRPFIIAKLMIAAKRAGIPTTEFAVGLLLDRAIHNARKNNV